MKKNLLLRLFLMTVVVLTLNSCRQDLLPEQETYHNTSAFQLKSNRIFLNEAKHKAKLLPELEKAEAKFKEKSSAFGKIVNYGNGVSIDTDDVTYIENGPNYHTYTFNIKRENAPADAPVENLVLSPLTDGTYRELLITYNFTLQEKQILMDGGFVDTKGKTTVTELASGTYSGALAKTSCSYQTVTINIPCTSSDQHMPGQDCDMTGNDAPRSFTMVALVCGADTSLDDDGSPGGGVSIGPTGGLGGDEDDGSGNTDSPSNGPINCNGGLTAPQTPNYDISDGGCGGTIPTQPTLPTKSKTPCQKIKEQRNEEGFKKRMDTLQGKTGLTKETGYIQKWGGNYEYKANAGSTSTANTLTLPEVADNTWIKAYMHTHVDDIPNSETKGIKMFSPADASYLMDLVQNAQTNGHSLSDPYGVMVTSTGNYQIRFTGNKFQIKTFTDAEAGSHRDPFAEIMKEYIGNPKQLELKFLKYIQEKMLLYGITLYRMNTDGTTTEIKLNADKTDTVENNCSN